MVYRIYVEKKPGFDVEANGLKNELTGLLGIRSLTGLRLLCKERVHPFFATFTAHLQHALAAQGLRTMLCSTTDETVRAEHRRAGKAVPRQG